MLHAQKKHVSFHTPGHKRAGEDITELSYSDNLLSPTGVIARAEQDIAEILGAKRSFILTDGSTSGLFSMVYALRLAGVGSLAVPVYSHPSVKNACVALGLKIVPIEQKREFFPIQPSEGAIAAAMKEADALLLTSPDYYGNFPPLSAARSLCKRLGKPFIIDGAHGAHLFEAAEYAGRYADLWVDGVHKSLPALTQGAVVSAGSKVWAQRLAESVVMFRTSSPSYPIMASVEYAVKYPRNEAIERAAEMLKQELGAYLNADWTKILIPFGSFANKAQALLERKGVYAEFNDGNFLMFYLSPCTTEEELKKLAKLVKNLPRGEMQAATAQTGKWGIKKKRLPLQDAIGKTCAADCGIFPPCIPLLREGDLITERAVEQLSSAKNTFGLTEGRITVFAEGS